VCNLPCVKCATKTLKIYGHTTEAPAAYMGVYGTDAANISALITANPALGRKLAGHLPYTQAEVVWAVNNEMARTVEDVLARRLRMLFIDARAAIEVAPVVAAIMANALHYDKSWEERQLSGFIKLARQYLLTP
jgi:glycerol-3-phosphate dehydrogenase